MPREDRNKRRRISELIREADKLFRQRNHPPDITPALPKMHAALVLAEELDDKTPLMICEASLASMNAVCRRTSDAMNHIDRAIEIAMDNDLSVPLRNFTFTKFIEIAVMVRREQSRALTYSRALVQSTADEEPSYPQFLAAVFNLAVVCFELARKPAWAIALLSWLSDEAHPSEHPVAVQSRRLYTRVARSFLDEERHGWLAEVEANRDEYLREATGGFLPEYAPEPSLDFE